MARIFIPAYCFANPRQATFYAKYKPAKTAKDVADSVKYYVGDGGDATSALGGVAQLNAALRAGYGADLASEPTCARAADRAAARARAPKARDVPLAGKTPLTVHFADMARENHDSLPPRSCKRGPGRSMFLFVVCCCR